MGKGPPASRSPGPPAGRHLPGLTPVGGSAWGPSHDRGLPTEGYENGQMDRLCSSAVEMKEEREISGHTQISVRGADICMFYVYMCI